MADLESLPADQRAVLQLVLQQGRTYDQLAGLLGIDSDAVRDRAYQGLDRLGSDPGDLSDGERADLADYLLGQASVSRRETARGLLAESPAAHAWASAVSVRLEPLGGDALPELPRAQGTATPVPDSPRLGSADAVSGPAVSPKAFEHFPAEGAGASGAPSSKRGGVILLSLVGLGVVVAVVLAIVLSSGGDDKGSTKKVSSVTNRAPAAATGATGATGATPKPIAQVPLRAADGGKAAGLAQVFARGSSRAVIVAGQGVTAGAYALWLYNSDAENEFLGFIPQRVGTDGKFVTQGVLPKDASKFKELVISKEQVTSKDQSLPKQPAQIVLRGTLTGLG